MDQSSHIFTDGTFVDPRGSKRHVTVPRAHRWDPKLVAASPILIDWIRVDIRSHRQPKGSVYKMWFRIRLSFLTNESSVLSLWQMVNVWIPVTSLQGAGSNNGGSSLASNDTDYVWHWRRLWLRAKRRTIPDHVGQRSYTVGYLWYHFTHPHPIIYLTCPAAPMKCTVFFSAKQA